MANYKMSIHALLAAESLPVPFATPVTPQRRRLARALPMSPTGSFSPVTASSKVKPLRAPRKRQRKPAAGPKKPRKSRVVFDFSLELLEQYFHLSQRDAAKMLAVSAITMKRNCKRLHIMWPYRSNKLKAARNVRERAPTSVTNGQQMGSSSRERIGSLSSSEDSERNKDDNDNDNNNNNYDDDDGDEDKYDGEDDAMSDAESAATAAVTQFTAALSLQPSLPSGAASHSDAALVFARLPFLCLAEKTLEERERATRSTRCVL